MLIRVLLQFYLAQSDFLTGRWRRTSGECAHFYANILARCSVPYGRQVSFVNSSRTQECHIISISIFFSRSRRQLWNAIFLFHIFDISCIFLAAFKKGSKNILINMLWIFMTCLIFPRKLQLFHDLNRKYQKHLRTYLLPIGEPMNSKHLYKYTVLYVFRFLFTISTNNWFFVFCWKNGAEIGPVSGCVHRTEIWIWNWSWIFCWKLKPKISQKTLKLHTA